MTLEYPDEPVGDFPSPPHRFTDGEDRQVAVQASGPEDIEALVDMYLDFDPEDRAQGIPPVREDAIRRWLESVASEDSYGVVAWHGDDPVGHALLVPDEDEEYELAIFVLHDYQGAHIGTELIRGLFGLAQEAGVEKVWLTVERWNDPAIRLYHKVGFETAESESFELEMVLRLS